MSGKKTIQVVFDTRSEDFENGKQYQSLMDQMNAVLQTTDRCRDISITQWKLYHDGNPVKGEENIQIPIHRHFYYDQSKNVYGGGFMLFEILEDLRRHYKTDDFADGLPDNIDLVFTITVTLV